MVNSCPLCSIIEREEILYKDSEVFLVSTKKMKGHQVRVMACIYEHRDEPTFIELTKAFAIINNYMGKVMGKRKWYFVGDTYASIPEHWHLMASDTLGNPQELLNLAKTPTVTMPIQTKKIMIGIPAYNEEKTIAEVVRCARQYGKVYVVNDGSHDNTFKRARGASFVYTFKHNRGYGASIAHLFKEAKENNVDIFITLDADGQHDPDEIPRFIQAIEEGADVAIGNRFLEKSDIPRYRKIGIKLFSNLTDVGDSQCGFRAYSSKAIEIMKLKEKGMGVSLEILEQIKVNNLTMIEVPCTIKYEGTSHSQNPIKQGMSLMETFFWGIVWRRPLSVLGIPALICTSIGIVFSIILLIEYARTKWFPVSLAFISLGGLSVGILLGISTLFVLIGKKLLRELK